MSAERPRVAITVGDPAGVGPEILAKALATGALDCCRPLLVGAPWTLALGAEIAGVRLPRDLQWREIDVAKERDFTVGRISAACGRLAVTAVEHAAGLALAGEVAAMVTCPINKAAVHAAGYADDIGHQEILARLSGATWTATLLMTPGLKVVHLSTHKSLIEAARFVTRANIVEKLTMASGTLARWGLARPRIAIAALNPHAGEGGLIGREEIDEIGPAVADLKSAGLDVSGPIPADSVFTRAIAGEFDLVLALYHDQGHIAIKVHNFAESITATLGIPFIRTSVDHGTAFDIAGEGVADPTSLVAAVRAAVAMARGELH